MYRSPFRCSQGAISPMRKYMTFRMLWQRMGNPKDVLDVGSRGEFTRALENEFNLKIVTTGDADLDVVPLSFGQSFDCIFIFEVLEHLFNPLHLLLEVKKMLRLGGDVFVTFPRHPHPWWFATHFHEFDEYRFGELVRRAGFKIIFHNQWRIRKEKTWGIRPTIRHFTDKLHFYELVVE